MWGVRLLACWWLRDCAGGRGGSRGEVQENGGFYGDFDHLGVGDSEVAGGELGGGGSLTSSVVVAQRRALLLAMTR